MSNYQNNVGAVSIGASSSLNNASYTVPASTDYSHVVEFRVDAVNGSTTTDAGLRIGSSGGLTNCISLRLNTTTSPPRLTMHVRTSSGQAPIALGEITVGNNYRAVLIGSTTALNGTNYPGANGSTDRAVVYLYDLGTSAARVRTPTAVATFSSDADLANAPLTTSTGVSFGSNSGNADWTFGTTAVIWDALLTKAQADALGQYTTDIEQLGVAWDSLWRLEHYSTSAVSGTPTGDEAFNLADRGTDSYDLTPSGANVTWTTDHIRQDLPTSEDTVQGVDFTSHAKNMSSIRTALAGTAGALLVVQGDSQAGTGTNRVIRPMMKALIDEGYELAAIAPRLRASGDPVAMADSVNTGADIVWYCNTALGTTYATNPGGASVRYGYPGCGGILELTRNGDALSIGVNNEIASVVVDNQIDSTDWTTGDDTLYARVFFYFTDDGNQFTGTVQLVGTSTVEVDLADTSNWRQFEVGGGSGGDSTGLYPNCWTTDVPLGTGAAARTLSIRLKTPAEFTLGNKLCMGVALIYKQRDGVRVAGADTFIWLNDADNSASWDDLYLTVASTADGDKGRTIAQEQNYLSLIIDNTATRVCRIVWMQTESESQATVTTNIGTWNSRWETMCSNLGLPAPYSVLMALPTNNVDGDSLIADRQHAIDYDAAYWAAASGRNGAWSAFRWTEGYLLATGETVADADLWTLGIGEGEEVAADATLYAKIGSTATCFVSDLLHIANTSFTAAMGAAWAADIAAAPIVTGGYNHARIRSVDRAYRLRI